MQLLGASAQNRRPLSWLPWRTIAAAIVLALGFIVASNAAPRADVSKVQAVQKALAQKDRDAASAAVADDAAKNADAAAARSGAKGSPALQKAATAARARAAKAQEQSASSSSAYNQRVAELHANRISASGSAYFAWFGVLAVALLWLASGVFAGDWNPLALAMGADNRLSTSKLQALLWTATVGFVYAMIYADRVIALEHVNPITNVPENVLFALGISATSAVAAKVITSSQVAANPDNKDVASAPSYDPANLVRDDGSSSTSLTKVQVIFWTVVAIVIYIVTSFHQLGIISQCTADCSFPDIDTTLMIFMGLGHATYLGGKMVGNTTPLLTKVVDDNSTIGKVLSLSGSSLGSAGNVLVNGAQTPDDAVLSWTATLVRFALPDPPSGQWSVGDQIALAVCVNGTVSPSITYVYSASAAPTAKSFTSSPVTSPAAKTSQRATAPRFAATAPDTRTYGIDVSWAQNTIDWAAVARKGMASFVYARASYGDNASDNDPNFKYNHNSCEALNIPFGAYHFFRFTAPAESQAQLFLSLIAGYTGTLFPAVDVEELSGMGDSPEEMLQNFTAFVRTVEQRVGAKMVIYTNQNSWNTLLGGTDAFAGHPLWVANVTEDPRVEPAMPRGFNDWKIHQYSWKGAIPQTNGSSEDVDLDVLKGALADISLPPRGVAPAQG